MSKKNTEVKEEVKVEDTAVVAENTIEATTEATTEEMTPEQQAAARVEMRKAMRERFGKWMEISDEDATDEDIEVARKTFEEKVEEWKNRTYLLVEKDKAVEAVEFLVDWNKNHNRWEKGAWRGVIAFDTIMNQELIHQKEEASDLMIDYQTLIFLHTSMSNPTGVGLESAKAMCVLENYNLDENKPYDDGKVTYSSLLQTIFTHVQMLQAADKMLNLYREMVTIAAAGIKCSFKITELEEFVELHEAWVIPAGEDGNHAM